MGSPFSIQIIIKAATGVYINKYQEHKTRLILLPFLHGENFFGLAEKFRYNLVLLLETSE